ncbi:hypothetical protein DES34_10661 [Brevibacillus brevis]|nr:hypothetical protein C7J99_30245 [Brevibacillus brevis]RED29274.1 hypothetical protein DES34_10661 [Brevibacillus brevis]VEF87875.1 Uncharacterised protein [Brevibacillus brevis]
MHPLGSRYVHGNFGPFSHFKDGNIRAEIGKQAGRLLPYGCKNVFYQAKGMKQSKENTLLYYF